MEPKQQQQAGCELAADSSKPPKKTILFVCLNTVSHVNSVLGMANHLRAQGHRTVFLFNLPFVCKLRELGHEVYDCTTPDLVDSRPDGTTKDISAELVGMCRALWQNGNPIETLEFIMIFFFRREIAKIRDFNDNVASKMSLLKPDLMISDHFFGIPALFKLNIPFVRVWSPSPLALHRSRELPQAWLGLPTKWDQNDPTQRDWNERAIRAKKEVHEFANSYWSSFGLADLPSDPIDFIPVSAQLNIYMYPEELDYSEYPLDSWQRCDCMVRDQKANRFEVPEKLRDKPGKLVFLSMGSMASADAVLMKRLTTMLADCPHRFIVVTGSQGDDYELPDNMWGDKFLPQLEILAMVDLIITHGGNNTLTESLYYGVPGFIVCPLFGDQFDNAQRVQEKGLGVRLDPYNCTKEELHNAIEKVLNIEGIRERVQAISTRMQLAESRNKPLKLIDDLVAKI